jgi:NADH-quinone oxidoreductase subunit H
MVLADLNIALLFFLGVSGMETLAAVTAGWGSHNKFSILGGMRAAAVMISYEVPMVLSLVTVAMMAGSLSTLRIAEAQAGWNWFVLTPWGFAGCFLFFISAMAELNRSPFDLLEAESELVAGYHTEYSGIKFALFYMAEYISLLAVCLLTTFLFLGGGDGPFLPSWVWMAVKTFGLIFLLMWARGTLPRFRIDHLMAFSWKFLLPLALFNIFLAGVWFFVPWPLWVRNLLGSLLLAATVFLLSRRSSS